MLLQETAPADNSPRDCETAQSQRAFLDGSLNIVTGIASGAELL